MCLFKNKLQSALLVVASVSFLFSGCASYEELSKEIEAERNNKNISKSVRQTFLSNVSIRKTKNVKKKIIKLCQNYVGHSISCSSSGAFRSGHKNKILGYKENFIIKNNSGHSITCWGGSLRTKSIRLLPHTIKELNFTYRTYEGKSFPFYANVGSGFGLATRYVCSRDDKPQLIASFYREFEGIFNKNCKWQGVQYTIIEANKEKSCKQNMNANSQQEEERLYQRY